MTEPGLPRWQAFDLVGPESRWADGPRGYGAALATVAVVTAVALLLFDHQHSVDAVMLYLLGVVLASLRLGSGPSLVAALLSVAAFDFIFIPPFLGFVMTDVRHFVTFVVMLAVAVVINRLTRRLRAQAAAAALRERRTGALYAMSRELGTAVDRSALVSTAAAHIGRVFDSDVVLFGPPDSAGLRAVLHGAPEALGAPRVMAAVSEVEQGLHELEIQDGPRRMLLLPLATSHGVLGVLGVAPHTPERLSGTEEREYLEAFVGHLGVAVERTRLAAEAERERVASEQERLRNALLSSVSHDLRTPLGAIEGAASTILALGDSLDDSTRRELVQTVHEEARRLGRRVANLLDMTRLEAGSIRMNLEWQPLEEVVGSTLAETEELLRGRPVETDLPGNLPPVRIDAVLFGQVLANLLENAAKYSPPGSPLRVRAALAGPVVRVCVEDEGPGVPPGEETAIFEKFRRASPDRATGGVGLGLAICRTIVEAHGGRIWCRNRRQGGAAFVFTVPAEPAFPPAEGPAS